jgi:tetratricopeptide (TPR) repeat protein
VRAVFRSRHWIWALALTGGALFATLIPSVELLEQWGYQLALWLGPKVAAAAPLLPAPHTTAPLPDWSLEAQRSALLGLGLSLAVMPNWLRGRAGLLLSAVLAVALVNAGLVALLTRGLWLPVAVPAAFLLAAHTLLFLNFRAESAFRGLRRELTGARVQLGTNLQNQGQLDAALEQFRSCDASGELCEPLYQLGLEFERRRQFAKALNAYEELQQCAPVYRDADQRRTHLDTVVAHLPGGAPAAGSGATGTVVVDNPGLEKPTLGRYRLERELGRGAMGVVYLGSDPKIDRPVAIKTLALTEEFEGKALAEARQRFLREAAAVGRLDHPNIVAVHDVGEEHDLAYIAMDYVAGQSLDTWIEPGRLLPVREVLEICAQVAEALDYAHRRKVVHRDIKPGNIIYDRDAGTAKVSDFGVASLLDDSKTRTGTVLGSPSYMSPEQVMGRKLDGRSDLFSLGATLYQLLTGRLPFVGDSLANLTYRITHERQTSISKLRRGLPACATRVVNRALQKESDKRFASGKDMAEALRRCRGR